MNKIFFALFALGCAGSALGQSSLRVGLADRSLINISVDNRYFNKRGQSVTVGDLPPGKHSIKIFETVENGRGRMREEMIYDGKIKTYNGQLTILTYDVNNSTITLTDEEMGYAANNNGNQNSREYNQGQNQGTMNSRNPADMDRRQPAGSPEPMVTNVDLSAAIKEPKLDKVKKKVIAKNTDTEKMAAAKDGLSDEQFTTAQVASIMDWFGFESTKVDFAEWAYPKTIDKQSFSSVKDKLTYQSYREDIDKFLNDHR